jgi:hypothetical protein
MTLKFEEKLRPLVFECFERLGRQRAALAMDRVKIRDATAVGRVQSQQVCGHVERAGGGGVCELFSLRVVSLLSLELKLIWGFM